MEEFVSLTIPVHQKKRKENNGYEYDSECIEKVCVDKIKTHIIESAS
jgi:hypothetical protein